MPILDARNHALLSALLRDARQSMRQLGAAVGLSPPSATERVRRLEDMGVISGYKPVLDPARIGWQVTAIISITARNGECDRLLASLQAIPNVVAVYHVAGDVDYVSRVFARDLAELQKISARIAAFGSVSTQVVLKTEFERDVLPAADG